ncbi:MAG: DNA repair protein RecO [Candidatus Paceibacterota bacterium]|jgi:DNA repair protein RecO (recombination protein O)
MHHIYHTEGIILGSRNYGEAGKYYSIFTRDLGMIQASAQGVRKMSSKLRFILQDYSYVKVDLVKGKDFWRVTSASKTNLLENLFHKKEAYLVFANIARLLKKLLAGEEANRDLFNDFLNGLFMLEKYEKKEELQNIEIITVLRILDNLGYIGGNGAFNALTKSPFEENLLFETAKKKSQILSQINQALKETHL